MTVTHKITNMELTGRGRPYQIHAKQGDTNTRVVEISLYSNNTPFQPPDGTKFVVRFRKPDGTSGMYDTMPDGTTPAATAEANLLTVNLAPQMLTCPGLTRCDVVLLSGAEVLATFDFHLAVEPSPVDNDTLESQDYYKVASLAQINAALDARIKTVNGIGPDENGNVDVSAGIPSVDATLTQEGKAADAKATGDAIRSLSEDIAKKANNVYIGPVQPTDGTLYWLDTSGSGGSGGETVTHTVTAALTNVSIDNTAESVNDGASFAATLTAADGYTISSVTVTMGGEDITASAYANGNIYIASVTGDVVITADAVEVPGGSTTYTITNNLLHATSDNSAVSVEENAAYTAKLTAETDYALETVTVTMGGVDVTADVYADGVINIPAVTGDVVITATTVYAPTSPVFELAEPFTGTGSGGTVLDYNIVDEDKTFSVAIDYSATPTTGIYVFGAGNDTNSLGIRGQGGYYWFAQSQYYKTAEIAYSTVTNKKVVLTYEKGSGNLLAHHVKTNGTAETITLAKGWTTGASSTTAVNPNGTINDLKIYARVLDESEINAYLGVK